MIYVVTGHNRTGTHMMLNAIAASSSLHLVHDEEAEKVIRGREVSSYYDPNPSGYHVAPVAYIPQENDLVKWPLISFDRMPNIANQDYMAICMQRDPVEIQVSLMRSFGVEFYDWQIIDGAASLRVAAERDDLRISFILYKDVIENPLVTFQNLELVGWPIDPEVAASTVDPALYRNRKES